MPVSLILGPETGQIGLHGWDGSKWLPILVDATGRLTIVTEAGAPDAHAESHENEGSDEISVLGLSGLLADGQTPLAHKASHQNAGADEISVVGLSGLLADGQTPLAHKASHQNAGADEISVVGLSGLLADGQTPLAHKASHESGGADVVDADTVDTKHAIDLLPLAATGTDNTKWTISAGASVWEDDPNLDISITLNVQSTIIVLGSVNFRSNTVADGAAVFRYIVDDSIEGADTGWIGEPDALLTVNPAVVGVFTGVAAGARKIELQAARKDAGHTVDIYRRNIGVIAIPE